MRGHSHLEVTHPNFSSVPVELEDHWACAIGMHVAELSLGDLPLTRGNGGGSKTNLLTEGSRDGVTIKRLSQPAPR